MNNCPELIHELSDFIDGVAAPEICTEIEQHLQDCPDCKVMVDTLAKTITLYQEREEDAELPDDVRKRLFHVLDLSDEA
jgi:predicted anti-sigma-YlaC factor YlaD